VAIVGSINRDLMLHTSALPHAGETVLATRRDERHGGKGANQAVAAVRTAQAGTGVALIAAVGDDHVANEEIANLERAGVVARWVQRIAGAATGTAYIMVDAAGENQIVVLPGANAHLTRQHVRRALMALHPRVVLISLEISDATVVEAVATAGALGATVILNPAPHRSLTDDVLGEIDVITPNLVELRQLLGITTEDADDPESVVRVAQRRLRSHRGGAKSYVITAGAHGAYLCRDGRTTHVPAPSVDVVDTVGAGDAFNGALAAYLANGALGREAVEFATLAAARVVATPGAQ
jgi:ribokinase